MRFLFGTKCLKVVASVGFLLITLEPITNLALFNTALISTNFNQSGIHLPFDKKIYEPVLKKLNELNINFTEKEINI